MITFENYERKIDKIITVLNRYGIKDLEDAADICRQNGIGPYENYGGGSAGNGCD